MSLCTLSTLRCYYNFVRPHRALKFGRETRTPAMQAGAASTRLTWSDIFTAPGLSRYPLVVVLRIPGTVWFTDTGRGRRSRGRTSKDWRPDQ